MTNYTITNTFINSEISAKRYEMIWQDLIERVEKSSPQGIDNDSSVMV